MQVDTLLAMSVPLSRILATFTGAWVKLGSCADIWISSSAKSSDAIDNTKLLHLPGSRCKSQSSASTANSGGTSGGGGDSTATNSGSFRCTIYIHILYIFVYFGAVYTLFWCAVRLWLQITTIFMTEFQTLLHSHRIFQFSMFVLRYSIRSQKQTGPQSCRQSMFSDIASRRLCHRCQRPDRRVGRVRGDRHELVVSRCKVVQRRHIEMASCTGD